MMLIRYHSANNAIFLEGKISSVRRMATALWEQNATLRGPLKSYQHERRLHGLTKMTIEAKRNPLRRRFQEESR